MIDDSKNFINDTIDVTPINEGNEWLKHVQEGMSHKPRPVLANKIDTYQYPIQRSSRQQRGIRYGI